MPNALKLLIIDDCPEDREIYREYLSDDPHHSYQFLEAPEAEIGLSLLLKEHCDVVLLDFHLPDMTGIDFLGALHQQMQQASIPIIMLTGQGDENIAVQAMKEGVQDYLVKQYLQPKVLQMAVRNVVRQAALQTLLQKNQDRQRLIATTALRIRHSLTLEHVLNTAVAEIQQLLACDRVAIYQCENGKPQQILAELGHINHIAPTITALVKTWETQTNQVEPRSHPTLITTEQAIAVPLSLPAQNQQFTTWGYLIAQQSSNRQWHADEESLLSELSIQLTTAIQQSELLNQTQAALQKAEEVNTFKSQIIATVAHEYRSPLAAILAAAATLNQHSQNLSPARQQRFLAIIQNKARHMAQLVDDMLLAHQCELDKAKFEPSPMNILQFIADLVDQQREAIQDSHTISLKIIGNTHGFWGDQGLLRMALNNLFANAIKYSPNGGEIAIELLGQTDTITIQITDQGIGIPSTDQAVLFESFSRGSNVEMIPGSGMGLAIARACIELHSGQIKLDSQEGTGTRLSVQLPKQPPSNSHIYYE
ncbi:response regulator [filamentous cyanobacterium LEGE 11480]|uniref:histidine kinase n=1 Tax=Romeriopsis navalis LEGE 11480 TaxID=2777977 RepID=A0A928VNG0_9CYAN|nr:ATP-binding protein [Romeriopsis navalis]MBE9031761.1 response regulator [Romeriopsis navalis LEGE 11480]